MTNILVTGANGQLGNEIRIIGEKRSDCRLFLTDVAELDITDRDAIDRFVSQNSINFIFNCAAYTAVDKAEDNADICGKINIDAAENLAMVAAAHNCTLVHISTDYVFDGHGCIPYTEEMPTNPQSVYGSTKLLGERKVMAACGDAVIIRTAWLYSEFGNNFVKTMIRLGNERDSLGVVFDQVGTPTYALDLASAVYAVMDRRLADSASVPGGIYHYSNEGVCSWYDFTLKIHQLAGITSCAVRPIESSEYPAKAPRPSFSVLNKKKIKSVLGIEVPHWEASLARCINELQK